MSQATEPSRQSSRHLLVKTLGVELLIAGIATIIFLVWAAVSPELRQNLDTDVRFLWWMMAVFCIPAILYGMRLIRRPWIDLNGNAPTRRDEALKVPEADSPPLGKAVVHTFAAVALNLAAMVLFLMAGGCVMMSVIGGFGFGGIGPDGPGKSLYIGLGVGIFSLSISYLILLIAFVLYGLAQRLAPPYLKRRMSKR